MKPIRTIAKAENIVMTKREVMMVRFVPIAIMIVIVVISFLMLKG